MSEDPKVQLLHVDDDPAMADLTAEFLERADERISVRTAGSADEGLSTLETADIDCIVSDYEMPGKDGIEFLEAVRAEYPDLPFILFTGKGSEAVASDAVSAGVTDYLQKESGSDQYTILANRVTNAVDRYRAQRVLEENRERLSMFVERSPLGVIEWNDAFEFVRVNRTAERILGYTEAELVGKSWEVIVPDAERESVHDLVSDLLDSADDHSHHTNTNRTKEGEHIICEWHDYVLTDDDGAVEAVFSQFQDITEQRERQRALRQERDRFKTLFDTLPVPAVRATLSDDDPVVRQVNPAFEETFGYDSDTIVGESLDAYLAPESVESAARAINRQVAETGRVTERVRRQTADGIREFRLEAVLVEESEQSEGYAIYVPLSDGEADDSSARDAKIEALHDVAVELDTVGQPKGVYEIVAEAAERILDFDYAVVDTVDGDALVPVAVSEGIPDDGYYGSIPVDADDKIVAAAYRRGEPDITDDLTERDVTPADPTFRSALTVPIGEYGVFQAAARETDAFDRTDLELASLLCSHAEAALDRIAHEGDE